jgi:hypothetical protein
MYSNGSLILVGLLLLLKIVAMDMLTSAGPLLLT